MAWGRYYRYYSPYRKYKRYYNSISKLNSSRNFYASSANMTQNARFNINVATPITLSISTGTNATWDIQDIGSLILNSNMHGALKTVFDQYRIEKVKIKITPVVIPSGLSGACTYLTIFSALDRTGFQTQNLTWNLIKTYSSYRETCWPINGDSVPPHIYKAGQSDLVEKTSYTDTFKAASFPSGLFGISINATNTGNAITLTVSIEIDAQVRYRGVRLASSS